MKKFIVIYHAPMEAMKATANTSPEEQAKGMEAWMVWAKNCGDKLVDLGQPLMGGIELIPGGKSKASSRNVNGYSILQAESMEDAKALLQNHPHLSWDASCSIELHEAMPIPGM